MPADVVVAIEHRSYTQFAGQPGQYVHDGITFKPSDGSRWITNWPKHHYRNGVDKNEATAGRFKPTVRMFKNAFGAIVGKGWLTEDVAFSYAIECSVYSVPNGLFVARHEERYANVVNWLDNNIPSIVRVSGAGGLIGNGPEEWPVANAEAYREGLKFLWHEWGK